MSANSPMPFDELLAQAGWAKALAKSLVRDDDSADELVQRTWVAALRRPPGRLASTGSVRQWISSAIRNFARQDARERERRTQRERLVARPEASGSLGHDLADVTGGIESQRRLLEALASLAEPYRAALYARYFEGLPPREIASQTGVPVKTVKSQLARGLALLRARLDRDHGGDRGAWMNWILPMAAQSKVSTALLGALLVNGTWKICAGLLALVCALLVGVRTWGGGAQPPAVSGGSEASRESIAAPVDEPAGEASIPDDARAAVDGPVAAPFVHPHPAEPEFTIGIRGRVLDLDQRPVAFVRIVCEARDPFQVQKLERSPAVSARSDSAGWFDLQGVPRGVNLLVEDPRWVTVYKVFAGSTPENEASVYVAPRIQIAGTVLTPGQQPIGDAQVELRLGDSVGHGLDRKSASAYRQSFVAITDASGRFELDYAPACEGTLQASAPGWLEVTQASPQRDAIDLVLMLGAPTARPALLAGIVVGEDGSPIEAAHVALGSLTERTGPDGRFVLNLDSALFAPLPHEDPPGEQQTNLPRPQYARSLLRAVKYGYLPAEVPVPTVEEVRQNLVPRDFRLVLARGSLAIGGRVVEADGTGVAGATLSVLDETPFGMIKERVGETEFGLDASLEQMLRGGLLMAIANSSSDGRFVVEGLTARTYDLAALDTRTLRYAVVREVASGSKAVRIEMPPAADLTRVAGRVVSGAGQGVAGLDLHLAHLPEGARDPSIVRSVVTGEQGQFDLGPVDPSSLRLRLMGESIFLIMNWQPPASAKLDQLEIVVSRRCPVKVERTPLAEQADQFSFLDESGQPTQVIELQGPMIGLPERGTIRDGVSETYAAPETARMLVLHAKGEEIGRLAVQLVPGELTILRP